MTGARGRLVGGAVLAAAALGSALSGCTISRARAIPADTPIASATPTAGYVFHDGFEPPDGGLGWSTGKISGNPVSWKFVSPSIPAPHAGQWVLGTDGTGTGYAALEDSFAQTPPWTLPSGSDYTLRFYQTYNFDLGRDGGRIEYTTDGGTNWAPANPSAGYPTSIQFAGNQAGWPIGTPCFSGGSGWSEVSVSLGAYAGAVVRLRFRLSSDATVQSTGWYLDEVTIE